MAKKKKDNRETTIENYYDLRVDKVDELVAALKGETPENAESVSMNISDCTGVDDPKNYTRSGKQKQFNPYKTDFLGRVPTWLKACFIKWWFAGAMCYFFMWGLNISDTLDRVVLVGAVIGLVVDVLVNPLFRYMETDKKEYNAYMMFPFPFKAFWTFFTNILYYIIVNYVVALCYLGWNMLIAAITGDSHSVAGAVEPLIFGLFCLIVDMFFIGIKDGIVCLVRKMRKKESVQNV